MDFKDIVAEYATKYNISPPARSLCKRITLALGNFCIGDITPGMVEEYKIRRLSEATPATVNRELAILKRIFSLSALRGLIPHNTIACVAYCNNVTKRNRWLSYEEETRLHHFSPKWLDNVITFGLNTGMRRGEILELTWDHVYIDKAYIYIKRSKNGDQRCIPMNKTVLELLTSLQSFSANSTVFMAGETPITPSSLEYYFSKVTRLAGIEDLHFHDLRHTFATRMVQAGVDLYRVQLLLGHRSIAMTQRYSHHSVESLRSAIDTLV